MVWNLMKKDHFMQLSAVEPFFKRFRPSRMCLLWHKTWPQLSLRSLHWLCLQDTSRFCWFFFFFSPWGLPCSSAHAYQWLVSLFSGCSRLLSRLGVRMSCLGRVQDGWRWRDDFGASFSYQNPNVLDLWVCFTQKKFKNFSADCKATWKLLLLKVDGVFYFSGICDVSFSDPVVAYFGVIIIQTPFCYFQKQSFLASVIIILTFPNVN